MSKEPLDQNVSVGAELTETALNVKAKSRLVTGRIQPVVATL
jgi:hypothetical protein